MLACTDCVIYLTSLAVRISGHTTRDRKSWEVEDLYPRVNMGIRVSRLACGRCLACRCGGMGGGLMCLCFRLVCTLRQAVLWGSDGMSMSIGSGVETEG
jgi:hypothetical protein